MDTMGGDVSPQGTDRGTAVEFVYRTTAADFEEALRARARRTPAGRAEWLLVPMTCAVASVALSVYRDASLLVGSISSAICVLMGVYGAGLATRSMARRTYGVMKLYGECRTVADDKGTVTTGERASSTADWSVFREYLETPGLFVVLGGDRSAGIGVLPKRGAVGPADVDRLRVILDRNLKRRG